MKKPKFERERPSLSILCSMYEACKDPDGMNGYYGTFGTKACEEYNEACKALGDRVHKYLEDWELGTHGLQYSLEDCREKFMAALVTTWITESGMKAVDCAFSENGKAIEVPLDSTLLDFSCRVDRITTFGNDSTRWVVDYKTSSSLKDSYKLQLCGYSLGWLERTGKWIDQGVLVRVEKSPKKKPQLEVLPVYNLHEYLEPLVLLRQMWDFINRKGIHGPNGGITTTRLLAPGLVNHTSGAQGQTSAT